MRLTMEPEARAQAGLFLSFQHPVEIPGVSNLQFLRTALDCLRKARGEAPLDSAALLRAAREAAQVLGLPADFLKRGVNEGFSGGEKKRNEILQMLLLELEQIRAVVLPEVLLLDPLRVDRVLVLAQRLRLDRARLEHELVDLLRRDVALLLHRVDLGHRWLFGQANRPVTALTFGLAVPRFLRTLILLLVCFFATVSRWGLLSAWLLLARAGFSLDR